MLIETTIFGHCRRQFNSIFMRQTIYYEVVVLIVATVRNYSCNRRLFTVTNTSNKLHKNVYNFHCY